MRVLCCLFLLITAARADYRHFEARQVHPLALTPDGARLVAADSANARVTVFDLSGPSPLAVTQIPVGLEPVTVRARTSGEVWVVNEVGDSVSIINLTTQSVIDTLATGDEPTDVAFAAGKAFVACARDRQIRVYDATTRVALDTIPLQGLYPHALAVTAGGTRLHAAFLLSGNGSTILKKELAPSQGAPANPELPEAPDTALIVPADDPRVTATILDHDLAEIDTDTHEVIRYVGGVGTNLFDLQERPGSNEIWVTHTEALNLVRFEPVLRGHFVDNRVAVVTPDDIDLIDLNPGVDYTVLPNPAAQSTALAQPGSLAFSADGSRLWIAAFASDRIARLDPETGEVASRVDLRTGADTSSAAMRGPRGLALDEVRGRLYVLNKLSASLTIIATDTETVLDEMPLSAHDPMPRAVREGRGYLFDARLSGNGTNSCGICHIDADRDGLAWDLGDPGGDMLTVLGANLSVHDTKPRPRVMHPMKGPMVTQTLRGMQNGAPFHWRGDKPTLQSFNSTFDRLMGGSQIDAPDMEDLAAYLLSLVHHSNPNRRLDRALPTSLPHAAGNPVTGRDLFNNHNKSHCATCHLLPEGTDHNIDLPQEAGLSQPVKNPPLRTTYQRLDYDSRPGATSLSGFGLLHDGTGGAAALPTVHPYVLDLLETPQEFADLTAFIRCFDTGTARTVGYSRTVTAANRGDATLGADLALLEARASASPADCDLIVRGRISGTTTACLWNGATYQTASQTTGTRTRAELLAALDEGDSLTFLGVLPGAGTRLGIDVDEDGVLDGDDPEPGVVNGPPRITLQPQSLAVAPGAPATLSVGAEGKDLHYQWKLGTTHVGIDSPTYTIGAATAADAGSYTVVVSNSFGARTSQAAMLSVVPAPVITRQPVARSVNEGANISFSVSATGTHLSYQWRRGNTPIGGANQATLTLAGVGAQDVGNYSVIISNGDTSVTSEPATLSVLLRPVLADLAFAEAVIGQEITLQLTAANGPTKFTASGLPPGLKLDGATGRITGHLAAPGSYRVRAAAANAAGAGILREATWVVQPFPGAALGTYQGIVPRDPAPGLGGMLGGRLLLTPSKLGAFSGVLWLGSAKHAFKGRLDMLPDADPAGRVDIPRKEGDALTLVFTLDRDSRSLREAELRLGEQTLELAAALPSEPSAVADQLGNFTFALLPAAEEEGPRGCSIGAFKITPKGLATGVVLLADGSPAVKFAAPLLAEGVIPVFALTHGKHGSLLGRLQIDGNRMLTDSSLDAFKHPQPRTRSYPDGFGPQIFTVLGGAYSAPATEETALGLPADDALASLTFSEGGAPDPATRLNWTSFQLPPGSPAKPPPPAANPGQVQLTVVPGSGSAFTPGVTGCFKGKFKLSDPDPTAASVKPLNRSAAFTGMIVNDGAGWKGYGFFNLAELPSAGPPASTLKNSLILSGRVELQGTAP